MSELQRDPHIRSGAGTSQGNSAETAASGGCREGEGGWGTLLMAISDPATATKVGMLIVPVPYITCQHKDLNNSGCLSQVMYVGVFIICKYSKC